MRSNDASELVLADIADQNNIATVDVSEDVDLALGAFAHAFSKVPDAKLIQHFGESKDVKAYYRKLLADEDVGPFHEGKLRWVRAYMQKKLVAFMSIEPNYHGPHRVYVSTLAVDPAFQGMGVGRSLLDSIKKKWFPDTQEIVLIVRKINDRAIGFYTKFGFAPAPEIDTPLLGPTENCQWMRWRADAG